jgi:hypothetical protein
VLARAIGPAKKPTATSHLLPTFPGASYGSLARYTNVERVRKVNKNTIVGVGGDYSDFQFIMQLLNEVTTMDFIEADGAELSPSEVQSFLSRVLHNRRNKADPLWNQVPCNNSCQLDLKARRGAFWTPAVKLTNSFSLQILTAGMQDGEPFLGYVDLYGSSFQSEFMVPVNVPATSSLSLGRGLTPLLRDLDGRIRGRRFSLVVLSWCACCLSHLRCRRLASVPTWRCRCCARHTAPI